MMEGARRGVGPRARRYCVLAGPCTPRSLGALEPCCMRIRASCFELTPVHEYLPSAKARPT